MTRSIKIHRSGMRRKVQKMAVLSSYLRCQANGVLFSCLPRLFSFLIEGKEKYGLPLNGQQVAEDHNHDGHTRNGSISEHCSALLYIFTLMALAHSSAPYRVHCGHEDALFVCSRPIQAAMWHDHTRCPSGQQHTQIIHIIFCLDLN